MKKFREIDEKDLETESNNNLFRISQLINERYNLKTKIYINKLSFRKHKPKSLEHKSEKTKNKKKNG